MNRFLIILVVSAISLLSLSAVGQEVQRGVAYVPEGVKAVVFHNLWSGAKMTLLNETPDMYGVARNGGEVVWVSNYTDGKYQIRQIGGPKGINIQESVHNPDNPGKMMLSGMKPSTSVQTTEIGLSPGGKCFYYSFTGKYEGVVSLGLQRSGDNFVSSRPGVWISKLVRQLQDLPQPRSGRQELKPWKHNHHGPIGGATGNLDEQRHALLGIRIPQGRPIPVLLYPAHDIR